MPGVRADKDGFAAGESETAALREFDPAYVGSGS